MCLSCHCNYDIYMVSSYSFIRSKHLTLFLLLLNTTSHVLANSVDPDQLASEKANYQDLHCLSYNMLISIKQPEQVI